MRRASRRPRQRPAGDFVDSRYALTSFHGITACTPNESEVEHLFGVRIGENLRVLEKAGRDLLAQTRARAVLVTRGSRGMALRGRASDGAHTDRRLDQIADVTGAGDT